MSQHEADSHTCWPHWPLASLHSTEDVGQPTHALQPSQQVCMVVTWIWVQGADTTQDLEASVSFRFSVIH